MGEALKPLKRLAVRDSSSFFHNGDLSYTRCFKQKLAENENNPKTICPEDLMTSCQLQELPVVRNLKNCQSRVALQACTVNFNSAKPLALGVPPTANHITDRPVKVDPMMPRHQHVIAGGYEPYRHSALSLEFRPSAVKLPFVIPNRFSSKNRLVCAALQRWQ